MVFLWQKTKFLAKHKGKQLIKRIYRIMLGQEDINVASRNKIITGTSYMDKVMTKAIYNLNKDKTR